MQSHTETMNTNTIDTTTTSTGITLRSGKTYSKSSSQYGLPKYELDGSDYIPLSSMTEYGWTWAQKVHESLACSEQWTVVTAYQFLGYLDSTSTNWCSVAWQTESEDTFEFGRYLMNLVNDFAEEATSIKRYPNTRSKTSRSDLSYCNGIIRLATDIASEWFVCSALHNGKRLKPEDKKLNQAEDKRLNHPEDEKLNQPEKKNINKYEDDTVSYWPEDKKSNIDSSQYWDWQYKTQGGYGHA